MKQKINWLDIGLFGEGLLYNLHKYLSNRITSKILKVVVLVIFITLFGLLFKSYLLL